MKKVPFIVFVMLGCIILMTSCQPPAPTIVTSLIPATDADSKVTKNGVTVEVIPINETNVNQHPKLACTYQYIAQSILGPVTKTGKIDNVLQKLTFDLKVTNNTGHIIKMTGSDIGLSVGGTDTKQLTKEEIMQLWVVANPTGVPTEVNAALDAVPLWNENTKILPGKTSDVYAVFNIFLKQGIGQASMSVYDLVTNTDAAGNPSERTNFDFNFKELSRTVTPTK